MVKRKYRNRTVDFLFLSLNRTKDLIKSIKSWWRASRFFRRELRRSVAYEGLKAFSSDISSAFLAVKTWLLISASSDLMVRFLDLDHSVTSRRKFFLNLDDQSLFLFSCIHPSREKKEEYRHSGLISLCDCIHLIYSRRRQASRWSIGSINSSN